MYDVTIAGKDGGRNGISANGSQASVNGADFSERWKWRGKQNGQQEGPRPCGVDPEFGVAGVAGCWGTFQERPPLSIL
jgi:hypothetical protein